MRGSEDSTANWRNTSEELKKRAGAVVIGKGRVCWPTALFTSKTEPKDKAISFSVPPLIIQGCSTSQSLGAKLTLFCAPKAGPACRDRNKMGFSCEGSEVL